MNDDEKLGTVIDVAPDDELNETADMDESNKPSQGNGSAKAAIVIALFALLVICGGLFFGYRYSEQMASDLSAINDRLAQSVQAQQKLQRQLSDADQEVQQQAQRLSAQQATIDAQQSSLDEAQQRFAAQEQLLDSERLKMQEREAELRASVADVHKRVGASGTQWMVAEAEYLLRLANNRLSLARDVGTARSALKLADQRLADTTDPGWNPVRDMIANELTLLDTARLPDIAGISAQLQSLADQVPQLHLTDTTMGGAKRLLPEPQAPEQAEEGRSWETLLDDLWAGFKDTVRIRRNDQPVQAMLAPEQQYFLYENLRLQLESARLGAARYDNELYHDSLTTAAAWLGSHFDANDSLTQAMRKQIGQLIGTNIRPALPDITQSLSSLRVRQKLNDDLARTAPRAQAQGGQTQ